MRTADQEPSSCATPRWLLGFPGRVPDSEFGCPSGVGILGDSQTLDPWPRHQSDSAHLCRTGAAGHAYEAPSVALSTVSDGQAPSQDTCDSARLYLITASVVSNTHIKRAKGVEEAKIISDSKAVALGSEPSLRARCDRASSLVGDLPFAGHWQARQPGRPSSVFGESRYPSLPCVPSAAVAFLLAAS